MEITINEEQRANLTNLAAHLKALPDDYGHFGMSTYANVMSDGYLETSCAWQKPVAIDINVCGTAACAVGHGPVIGIEPLEGEDWTRYAARAFGATEERYNLSFDWLFSGSWGDRDDTTKGAAFRIEYYLKHGIPKAFTDADGYVEDFADDNTGMDIYAEHGLTL
jgi:hypothetical protein